MRPFGSRYAFVVAAALACAIAAPRTEAQQPSTVRGLLLRYVNGNYENLELPLRQIGAVEISADLRDAAREWLTSGARAAAPRFTHDTPQNDDRAREKVA